MAFKPSPEQKAILDAEILSQCVLACAGSGKTATAVRRLQEIRRRLGHGRGYVALLSYSNPAVTTFRKEYLSLRAEARDVSPRVVIETVDSFITTFVLKQHATRVMGSPRQPFLVNGTEPFLTGFKVFNGKHKEDIGKLRVSITQSGKLSFSLDQGSRPALPIDKSDAEAAIHRLGAIGAYTHEIGRYWALYALAKQPRLRAILARRFPQVLVDEAQDIGDMHGFFLSVLHRAGSQVSLIGDSHQAIFEFAGADGSFLQDFAQLDGRVPLRLSENRRSVAPIVNATNALFNIKTTPMREAPERKHGAFLLTYKEENLDALLSAYGALLEAHQYPKSSAAVLCRGNDLAGKLTGSAAQTGVGATELFANAAMMRDRRKDVARAFESLVDGVLKILERPPDTLRRDVLGNSREPAVKALRGILWRFFKDPAKGLPSTALKGKSGWHTHLKARLPELLAEIEMRCGLKRLRTWGNNVTSRNLSDQPLCEETPNGAEIERIRVSNVHQVKGESIDAVLYVTKKTELRRIVNGTGTEEGRIGYVAVTRARDLLIMAVPEGAPVDAIDKLRQAGFRDFH